MKNPIELGTPCKDTITDFKGTSTGKAEYLFGCTQIQIEGVDKDGEPKSWWFDFQRVEPLKGKKKIKRTSTKDRPGGPQNTPTNRNTPNNRR